MVLFFVFFFSVPATTEIYTLSLHDALPISCGRIVTRVWRAEPGGSGPGGGDRRHRSRGQRRQLAQQVHPPFSLAPCEGPGDRKSTRLNSSHMSISYAVFCLKKKKTIKTRS